MSKCHFCEYKDISYIVLYDCMVQICSKCDIVRVSVNEYSELMYKVLYSLNIGKIKSYTNTNEFSKDTIKNIQKFLTVADLTAFKVHKLNSAQCNVCRSDMACLRNRYDKFFKIYYCIDCNSIYFNKNDFLEFVDFIKKIYEPFSLKKFLKEIFSFKKRKDNAKEQTVQSELLHKKNP